jgi:hypothetical protein
LEHGLITAWYILFVKMQRLKHRSPKCSNVHKTKRCGTTGTCTAVFCRTVVVVIARWITPWRGEGLRGPFFFVDVSMCQSVPLCRYAT